MGIVKMIKAERGAREAREAANTTPVAALEMQMWPQRNSRA